MVALFQRLPSRWRAGVWVALILSAVLLILRLWPSQSLQSQALYSTAFLSSDGALLRLTLARDEQYRVWTPLAQIDPRLIEAVQLYEDQWFQWHPGVNPVSLVRGAVSTWRGSTRRGGSTLSMQLARRLYRIDSRSAAGKLHQIGAALWLEARHSKREILEAYLNLAPYGGNIEGVGAASLIYFGKRADTLPLPEALALAVIPQNPNRRAGEPWPQALGTARGRLWARWLARHPGDARSSLQASLEAPLQLRSAKALPFAAPHAVQTLARQMQLQAPTAQTRLSLHAPTQRVVERTISQFLEGRKHQGLRNAAALLVDTESMQVRAWVGSANWSDESLDGQVNATTAKRSPGSTLKPFIYALALDQGVLHPASILKDAPAAFGTYSPENFDGRFEGPITAAQALVRSRNIPAVQVSSQLRQPSLHEFLRRAGVSQLASEAHYGLALALGGGELSMEELATLYAMLANDGVLHPLNFLADATPSSRGAALLSPEAAFVTLDMLRDNPRPDTGEKAFPRVAWKTGTSWGFRDAWTAGLFGRHVLVVWLGNFDGSANPALVGIQAAAPLFFQIVDALRSQGLDPGERASRVPAGLSRVKVCAASGDLPNEHCPRLAETWFIPGVSPIKLSTLHRPVLVDEHGRAACQASARTHVEVFEYWRNDMRQIFAQAGMPRRMPPAPARCDKALAGEPDADGPRIVSPLEGGTYLLPASRPQALNLRANGLRSGPLYWFADSIYLGSSEPGADLPWRPPAAGRYTVSAVDSQGRSDLRAVQVELIP